MVFFGQVGVAEEVAGSGDADEGGVVECFFPFSPGEDFFEGVGAGDEEEFRGGEDIVQVGEGVDGVGGAGSVDVDAADAESGVAGGGDDGHEVSVFGGGYFSFAFLPGLAGGHEDDFVEVEEVGDFGGGDKVPVVDGVKGAAHDANAE